MFTDETTETGTENTSEDTSTENSGDETAEETKSEQTQTENAKDWESEAKKWKAIAEREKRKATKTPADQNLDTLVEEKVLKNMGMDDESLAYLKKVAALNGQSLGEAQKDNVYLNWKAVREQSQKVENAQVGASKGSGSRSQQPTFTTQGLSQDQHKEMWKKAMGM